jgi:hypothetical protein
MVQPVFTSSVVRTSVLVHGVFTSPLVRTSVLVHEGCTIHVFSISFKSLLDLLFLKLVPRCQSPGSSGTNTDVLIKGLMKTQGINTDVLIKGQFEKTGTNTEVLTTGLAQSRGLTPRN